MHFGNAKILRALLIAPMPKIAIIVNQINNIQSSSLSSCLAWRRRWRRWDRSLWCGKAASQLDLTLMPLNLAFFKRKYIHFCKWKYIYSFLARTFLKGNIFMFVTNIFTFVKDFLCEGNIFTFVKEIFLFLLRKYWNGKGLGRVKISWKSLGQVKISWCDGGKSAPCSKI